MCYTTNLFLAAAKALWDRGEDGEVIARELAEAFYEIALEGSGDPLAEFVRLMPQPATITKD